MRSFIFQTMLILMIVWTSLFVMELSYMYFSSDAAATIAAGSFSMPNMGRHYVMVREGFWGTAAAARVTVWALPMLIMSVISAIAQPPPTE